MELTFVLCLGVSIGSFMSVVVCRLPAQIPMVKKGWFYSRSQCPQCNNKLAWWMNIPVLSWLLLRGVCFYCNGKISLKYPFFELAYGLFACAVYFLYGISFYSVAIYLCGILLFALVYIDKKHMLLPNALVFPVFIIGFLSSFLDESVVTVAESITSSAIIFTSIWVLATLFEKISGRVGIGGGDIKLYGALGAWCNLQVILYVVIFSSLLAIFHSISRGINIKEKFPFGPYIICAFLFIYLIILLEL